MRPMDYFAIKFALCQGALASGAPLPIRIRGTSMLPALRSGDLVCVHGAHFADIHPGHVVVFARNGHFVAHRVVQRMSGADGLGVVTRGDAQPRDDSVVAPSELLGVVTSIHRFGARHAMRRRPTAFARGIAWMIQRSPWIRSALDRLNHALVKRSLPA